MPGNARSSEHDAVQIAALTRRAKPVRALAGAREDSRRGADPFGVEIVEPRGAGSWHISSWAFGLLALAALIAVVLHFGTIEEFARLAAGASPSWLLVACLAQAGTYVCAALVWHRTLRHAGHPRRLAILVPLGVAKLFTDQVVPTSGVSGAILVARALVRRRVPTRIVMATLLVGLVSYFAAYLISAMTSLALLWLHHRANAAFVSIVALFAAVVVAIPSGVLWLKQLGQRIPVIWVRRLPAAAHLLRAVAEAPSALLVDPRLLAQTVTLEFLIFALDALTLWLVFRALGHDPGMWVAFVSFVMASIFATLGPIPLGLGTFEAGCVGMLGLLDVPIETALAATIILRGLTFWMPMIPGLWLVRRELRSS